MITALDLDTEMQHARPELRETLIVLAEDYIDAPGRPCCDVYTTLRDWVDSGLYALPPGGSS